jgi:hypothetical protein
LVLADPDTLQRPVLDHDEVDQPSTFGPKRRPTSWMDRPVVDHDEDRLTD